MLRTILLATLTASLIAADGAHDPSTPEGSLMLNVQALRNDDFSIMLQFATPEERADMEAGWAEMQAMPLPPDTAQMDGFMAMLNAPGAVDTLVAMAGPQLAQMEPQAMAMGMGMGMQMAMQDPNMQALLGADGQATMGQIMMGMQTWVSTAGFHDENNFRQVATLLTTWAAAQDWQTVDALRAKSIDEVAVEAGEAWRLLKDVMLVYQLDIDATLDSISVSRVNETSESVDLAIAFNLFAQDHSVTATMIQDDAGRWVVKPPEGMEDGAGFGDEPPPF